MSAILKHIVKILFYKNLKLIVEDLKNQFSTLKTCSLYLIL